MNHADLKRCAGCCAPIGVQLYRLRAQLHLADTATRTLVMKPVGEEVDVHLCANCITEIHVHGKPVINLNVMPQ